MTDKEKQEFNTLYEYVKKLMGYDNNQMLTRDMILRLRGLAQGKYMANNNTQAKANYSYELIYHTFLFVSQDLKKIFEIKRFKDDNHKFNYMLKVVESHINEVYKKEKQAQRTNMVERFIDAETHTDINNNFKVEENKREQKTTIDGDWW